MLLALSIAGCGGGDGGESQPPPPEAPSPVAGDAGAEGGARAAGAEKVCAQMVAAFRRLGTRAGSAGGANLDALTVNTRELYVPALAIVESTARRLRAPRPAGASVDFDSYINLFDPIASILRERIRAGEAGEAPRARDLALRFVELAELQRALAQKAGLKGCAQELFAGADNSAG